MFSGSLSGNRSKSKSRSSQNVWAPQGDALQDLYGLANELFGGTQWYQDMINQQAQDSTNRMGQSYDMAATGADRMMQGGAVGDTADIRKSLLDSLNRTSTSPSNTAQMYQSIVGGEGNEYIDPVVGAMKDSAMDNFNRMSSSNAVDAAMAGQGGSSRHAMMDAMLGKEINKDLMAQEANLRSGAYDKDLQMKLDIANLADQNVMSSQDKMLDMLRMSDANLQSGTSASGGLSELGNNMMSPWMSAQDSSWNPMDRYADVVGGPTVLGSSSGKSSGWGFGSSASVGGKK